MLASVPESAPASSTGVWIWSLCLDFDRGFVLEVYIVLESGAGLGAAVGAGVGAGVGALFDPWRQLQRPIKENF